MAPKRSIASVCFLALFALLAPTAFSWGQKGHKIVGRIAERRLTAEARARVKEILGSETLADVSNWADAVRKERSETAPWHYVNVAAGAERYDEARDCGEAGCVASAAARFVAVLKDDKADPQARREALMWVVHLIADLHQPLHCAYAADRGGNDVQVVFEGTPTNLHAVWDTEIIERQHLDEQTYAEQLLADVTDEDAAEWTRTELRDWIDESWGITNEVVYRDARGRKIASGAVLTRDYLTTRTVVVDRRLKQAGVRLAMVLNAAFAAE